MVIFKEVGECGVFEISVQTTAEKSAFRVECVKITEMYRMMNEGGVKREDVADTHYTVLQRRSL